MKQALGQTETLEETVKRLRGNLPAYTNLVLKIRDKEARLIPFKLNYAQQLVHDRISQQLKDTGRIRAVILKARQEGVSTYTAARFFRGIHLLPGRHAMVLADTLERAGALFDIYNRYLENLPEELTPATKSQSRQRLMAFSHDSQLQVRPGSDTEAGRTLTLHFLHASELAFWGTDAQKTWVSLMQAVPKYGSEIIVESTAKGAGGLFHEIWQQSQQENSGWVGIFLPWFIHDEYEIPCPEYTRDLIDSQPDDFERQALTEGIPFEGKQHFLSYEKLAWRRMKIIEDMGGDPVTLGRDATRAFQQEFPATAEEAFLMAGSCFFDEDELRRMTREVKDPEMRGRLIKRKDDGVDIDRNARGFVRIYEKPALDGHYVIGVDTASGKLVSERAAVGGAAEAEVGGRDYSAAVVVRLPYTTKNGKTETYHPPKVVAEVHGHVVPEMFAEQLNLLGQYYSCGHGNEVLHKALIAVERNHSSGQTIVRLLREVYRYSPLYWQKEINKRTRMVMRSPGWRTDETNRMIMLDTLGEKIRKSDYEIPSKALVNEMVTFVVWPDGKPQAEENCHDDRVIGLALATMMMPEHRHSRLSHPETFVVADTPTGL